jgi:hypothetical protein
MNNVNDSNNMLITTALSDKMYFYVSAGKTLSKSDAYAWQPETIFRLVLYNSHFVLTMI